MASPSAVGPVSVWRRVGGCGALSGGKGESEAYGRGRKQKAGQYQEDATAPSGQESHCQEEEGKQGRNN